MDFQELLHFISKERGFDFTQYRPTFLKRRIGLRFQRLGIENPNGYINLLRNNPEEYAKLFDTLSIRVSEFFRNPSCWDALQEFTLPEILQNKLTRNLKRLRIWSAGTSQGQEAYSAAICLKEALGEKFWDFKPKVYGTDVDTKALAQAKEGFYEAKDLKNVKPTLLKKYFLPAKEGFVIQDTMRLMTQLMPHNLVTQKPLLNMDLILCRNVLIYFSKALQKKICEKFHRALNSGGYLMLGQCEGLNPEVRKFFKSIHHREKIYQICKG